MADFMFVMLICTIVFYGGFVTGGREAQGVECDLELKNKYIETITSKKNDIEIIKEYHRNQIKCTIDEEINKKIVEDLKGKL